MAGRTISCAHCGRSAPNAGRGLCKRCYMRLHKRGEIHLYGRVEKPFLEWIALIDTSDPGACWPWPGPVGANGYGQAGHTSAHRAVYAHFVGPLADEDRIDHRCCWQAGCGGGTSCPHRRCVNWVNHLEPVSNTENQLRSPHTLAGRGLRTTHCPAGHPYDAVNTYVHGGRRSCRACRRVRDRHRRAAQAAARSVAAGAGAVT